MTQFMLVWQSLLYDIHVLYNFIILVTCRFFDRDVECICEFFKKRFNYTDGAWVPIFRDIVYVHDLPRPTYLINHLILL